MVRRGTEGRNGVIKGDMTSSSIRNWMRNRKAWSQIKISRLIAFTNIFYYLIFLPSSSTMISSSFILEIIWSLPSSPLNHILDAEVKGM